MTHSRRTLLRLLSAATSLAGDTGRGRAADAGTPGRTMTGPAAEAATRAALARLDPATIAFVYLDEGARGGLWRWRQGDHVAAIAADPLQGLTVAHATIDPGTGAWVRDWNGRVARPEWFGARADDSAHDNRAALQAALDLCPAVQMGPGSYHVSGRLLIVRNGTHLLGAGLTQTDQGANSAGTQIVCASTTETILQVGTDSPRQPSPLVEGVQLRDFTVRRAAPPFVPATGFGGAIGIAMRWCVNCHVERVFSIDSARGWFFYGTIENYITRCSALRGRAGADPANDSFIGFHLDYTAPLAANGGNASLYFDHCRAFAGFGEGRPPLKYAAGLRTDGGWVDLYINAFETGLIGYGIDGHGDAYGGGASYRTEDLIITNCVLDPGDAACIRLQTADTSSAVQIMGSYMATGAGGTCVELRDLGGSVSLIANQCIATGGGTGLAATSVNNLRTANNIFTKLRRPIRLTGVTSFHLGDAIHALDTPNPEPAVALAGCTRGKVDCIVNGRGGAHGSGVHVDSSSLIEIACTNLQAGVGPKLVSGATAVTQPGPFGDNCLASGIMA